MNIHAVLSLLSEECKLPSLGWILLENLEADSVSCGMIASGLKRMMEVDLVLPL